MKGDFSVLVPNLGLYFDRPPLAVPERGMIDCLNVRVKDGRVIRDNLGWGRFPDSASAINLEGLPVTGIHSFFPRGGGQLLVFATTRDIYKYNEATKSVSYLNPRYETGTVAVTNGSPTVTGTGTVWTTNLKANDYLFVGATGEDAPAAAWYRILTVDSNTQVTLATNYTGATASGQAYTGRSVFTGGIDDYWRAESFPFAEAVAGGDGDRYYLSNGLDAVVAWDGVATQVYRPSLGGVQAARIIRRFQNIMIYGDIVVSGDSRPFSIRTSAIGQPENLTTAEASEFVVGDGTDPLKTAVPLGDVLALYGERSITLTQFVGPPANFVFRAAVSGVGVIAGRAVADFGSYHEFIGTDAQYRFDGITVTEIGRHVWRDILRSQSPQRRDLVQAHFDDENGEVLWIVPLTTDADPTAGAPEFAFVEHYLELVGSGNPRPVTRRQVPALSTGYFRRESTLTFDQISTGWDQQNYRWNDRALQGAFPLNLFGTATGDVLVLNDLASHAGAAVRSYARFSRRSVGSVAVRSMVQRVYPLVDPIQGAVPLDVLVYGADSAAGSATLRAQLSFDMSLSGTNQFVNPRASARFVELQFGLEDVGSPFFIQGYDMTAVPGGAR